MEVCELGIFSNQPNGWEGGRKSWFGQLAMGRTRIWLANKLLDRLTPVAKVQNKIKVVQSPKQSKIKVFLTTDR